MEHTTKALVGTLQGRLRLFLLLPLQTGREMPKSVRLGAARALPCYSLDTPSPDKGALAWAAESML